MKDGDATDNLNQSNSDSSENGSPNDGLSPNQNFDETSQGNSASSGADGDDVSVAPLTAKTFTKAAANVAKTLALVNNADGIEAKIREDIKEAKKGQLVASQRDVAGEPSPEGQDVESWTKKVRKLNNKLDKHMTENEGLEQALRHHAGTYRSLADQLTKMADSLD
ncbi:hypothetical protein QEL91_004165 [Pseudomonas putida]|nr:hypothetical protein [Pseudomonas putida]